MTRVNVVAIGDVMFPFLELLKFIPSTQSSQQHTQGLPNPLMTTCKTDSHYYQVHNCYLHLCCRVQDSIISINPTVILRNECNLLWTTRHNRGSIPLVCALPLPNVDMLYRRYRWEHKKRVFDAWPIFTTRVLIPSANSSTVICHSNPPSKSFRWAYYYRKIVCAMHLSYPPTVPEPAYFPRSRCDRVSPWHPRDFGSMSRDKSYLREYLLRDT